eukprot:1916850-Alexandrium_andersonii.AAC.1
MAGWRAHPSRPSVPGARVPDGRWAGPSPLPVPLSRLPPAGFRGPCPRRLCDRRQVRAKQLLA